MDFQEIINTAEKKGKVDGFYINEPHKPKKSGKRPLRKNQFIPIKEFDKIWRQRAIFVTR